MSVFSSKLPGDRWEVIVVDNASTDGSLKELSAMSSQLSTLTVIQNSKNVGYAKANNIGMKQSHGKYILLLNSDTEVQKGTIQTMLAYMDAHQVVGAATCKLLLPDGSLDPACHRGFPTPWAAFTYFIGLEWLFPWSRLFSQYHMGYRNLTEIHEVDAISGAFFMVRRSVIDQIGLLDEDFFMYGEDLDWAYRMKQAGWIIGYNPHVSCLHHKKQSGRAHADAATRKKTEKYFYDTMRLFYEKHYAHRYGWLATNIILFGIKIRSML